MCIIAFKKAGEKHPSKKTLQICAENNPDFAGIMVATGNEVIIRKGFEGVRGIRKALREIEAEYNIDTIDFPVVYHFRIATSGLIKPQNAHPFPLSNKVRELQSTRISCNAGIAHNGIIQNVGNEKNISDTQLFIRDFLSLWKYEELMTDRVNRLVGLSIGNDKLIALYKTGAAMQWGTWYDVDGISYSNETYKSARIVYGSAATDWGNYIDKGTRFTREKCVLCGEKTWTDLLDANGICKGCRKLLGRQNFEFGNL